MLHILSHLPIHPHPPQPRDSGSLYYHPTKPLLWFSREEASEQHHTVCCFPQVTGSLCTVHLPPRASLPSVMTSDGMTPESDSILSVGLPVQTNSSEEGGSLACPEAQDTLTHACAQGSILTCD